MSRDKRLLDNRVKYEGKTIQTNRGEVEVLKYTNNSSVNIKFINTGFETTVKLCQILSGVVKDRLLPEVYGVGIIGADKVYHGSRENNIWRGLLSRCYGKTKRAPTYKDCTVSENFKYFPYFKDWCNKQIGFNSIDSKGNPFQLDKDILIKGNRVYSEDTCCFVPSEINLLFTRCDKARGKQPIGVYFSKLAKKFCANLTKESKSHNIGHFNTSEEAFFAYKQAKETHIKEVANKWKDQIDPRVYEALITYEVEIND